MFKRLLAVIAVIGMLLIAGCGKEVITSRPVGPRIKGTHPTLRPYVIAGKRYYPIRDATGFVQKGKASWYGKKFHGRKTANGEIYDMHAMTAAHKILPMNTWVKVTHTGTGKSIVVRVNDRGPFVRGRIIDLSYTGAQKLGAVRPGTIPVRVVALGWRKEMTTPTGRVRRVYVKPKSYREGRFTVQVGAFKIKPNADRLAARLTGKYGYSSIRRFDSPQGLFYRVRTTLSTTLARAEKRQKELRRAGFSQAFVVAVD